MELITLLMIIGLFFGIIPGIDVCTLDAEDCAIIEETGVNMRSLSALTIDDLTIILTIESGEGELIEEATISANGPMAWNNGQVEMDMQLNITDSSSDEDLQFIIKNGTAHSYDAVFEERELLPFSLDVRSLPTLRLSEAEWSGSDGDYTLTITSPGYLSSDSFLQMGVEIFRVIGVGDDADRIAGELESFFGQLGETDVPYTINYTIEDGYITDVQSTGQYTFLLLEKGTTVSFSMTLSMSNHNGDVTIESPDVETSYSFDDTDFSSYAGVPLASGAQRDIVAAEDVAAGVVRGVTEEGFPFIGSPDAPITIAEFGDFSCPHCGDFMPEWEQMISEFVRNGKLRAVFVPMTFVGGEWSVSAAHGALCAAEQGAFWEYHHVLFDIQENQSATAFTTARMRTLASAFGLDAETFTSCMTSEKPSEVLRNAEALRAATGVNATPTLIYRIGDGEWQRFEDENGAPLARKSYEEISQLVRDNQ